jgi:ectoine hydroxylase-related dioxygenase (phytanoyl-CoA dioxygenase family)
MPRQYTDSELQQLAASYDEHGTVHLPDFLDADTVGRVLGEIDRAAAASTGAGPVAGMARSFGRGRGRMTIRSQSDENPVIREFLLQRALAEPIARICGSRVLQFWFDLTFIHEAAADGESGEGSGWHHDISAFGFKGEKLPSLWMAMTPAVEGQSRIEFIDGSHRRVPGYFRPPTSTPRPDDPMLEIPDYDALLREGREKRLAWDCAPGDALLIHPYTIHGAKGNAGSIHHGRRVAITTRWLGDDVRWLPLDPRFTSGAGIDPDRPPALGSRPSRTVFPVVWGR